MRPGRVLFFLLLIDCFELQAQDKDSVKMIYLDPVTINEYTSIGYWWSINRSVDIIDGKNVRQPGTVSIDDALRSEANISLQSRGNFGVQTDIGIRGSLFSQNLILLNGVSLSDPQTAHHNFDIPVPTTQIKRVEVLKGAGSAQYGANASGGVINIITEVPEESSGSIRLSGGEHGFFEGIGSLDIAQSFVRSANTLEVRRSDGYHYDADFLIASFTTNTEFKLPTGDYTLLGGYSKKTFGAFDFYSPGRNKPSKEWTETTLLNLSTSFGHSSLLIVPGIFFRKHNDRFMYDIRIPDKYTNVHTTQTTGGEIKGFYWHSRNLKFITGLEANYNTITSSSLGDHTQSLFAAHASLHYFGENYFTANIGIRGDFHSNYGNQFSPTLDLGYLFTKGRVFASIGRSFRTPSYTELYYSDPSTAGNPNLHPEIGRSYELGAEYGTIWKFTASFFERDQINLIDYVRYLPSDTQSVAANFISARTRGLDAGIRWESLELGKSKEHRSGLILHQFKLFYEYLDSKIDRGNIYSSRYAFTHPRHRISTGSSASLYPIMDISLDVDYNIKYDNDRYALLTARAARQFSSVTLFIRGTNLLDESYEEIIGVPLPGRWLWAGIELKVF